MMRPRWIALGSAVVLAAAGLLAAPALATFHEMSIREVYPGSIAQPESGYVELQMWAPGQNLVGGHSLKTYSANGTSTVTTTFAGDVAGAANQSTILLATPAAESQFGVIPDAPMAPGQLSPAGGAVCWVESIDCVSWGNFSGGALPSPAGFPALPSGIPDGMAIRRSISAGCPTQLEPGDDHDNSAADFASVFPAPRPNSVAPSERSCGTPGNQQGGPAGQGEGSGRNAPQTTLKRKPPRKTRDSTPTFRFSADEPGSTFQCKLDRKAFRTCRSPFTTKRLHPGFHAFKVRARDDSGKLDPSPASYSFEVIAKR
jgi:hypothetical protein